VLSLNSSSYDAYLLASFGDKAGLVNSTYPLSMFSSSPAPVFTAINLISTLVTFRCPARRIMRTAAPLPVWTYSFNHTLTCAWYPNIPNNPQILALLGSTHTAELPFVFGQTTNMPPPSGNCSLTDKEKDLSTIMRTAWDGMAADGKPGVDWPIWTQEESMGINVVGDTWGSGKVDYSMCDFWDKLDASTATPTSSSGPTKPTTSPSTSITAPTSSTSGGGATSPTGQKGAAARMVSSSAAWLGLFPFYMLVA